MGQHHKIVIVTGAGSGIGKAVAIALNNNEWTVILAGRREQPLHDTSRECAEGSTLVVPTDVTNPKSVKDLFSQTLNTYGRLDLLFNNAGVSSPIKPLEEITFEEWETIVATNRTGAFLCTQEAFRIMKSQ